MAEVEKEDRRDKHPGGRPLKYETVEQLDQAIRAYFDSCDPHTQRRVVDCGINDKGETIWREREVMTEQKPYTMSGLARAMGIDRKTLLSYKNKDKFLPSIRGAKARCEEYWEGRLDSPYANGAKFNLANNYGDSYQPWAEKQSVDHTTGGEPIKTLVEFVGGGPVIPTNGDDPDTA